MYDAKSRILTATNGNEWLKSCGHEVGSTQTLPFSHMWNACQSETIDGDEEDVT